MSYGDKEMQWTAASSGHADLELKKEPTLEELLGRIVESLQMALGELNGLHSPADSPAVDVKQPYPSGIFDGARTAEKLAVMLRDECGRLHARLGHL